MVNLTRMRVLISYERRLRFKYQKKLASATKVTTQLTGMPRGTNDPEAALIQRADTDEVLDKIEKKCAELRELVDEFETIMDAITDRRLQIIVRNYYALGWTDERIGEQLEITRQHVNRLRTAYIEELR